MREAIVSLLDERSAYNFCHTISPSRWCSFTFNHQSRVLFQQWQPNEFLQHICRSSPIPTHKYYALHWLHQRAGDRRQRKVLFSPLIPTHSLCVGIATARTRSTSPESSRWESVTLHCRRSHRLPCCPSSMPWNQTKAKWAKRATFLVVPPSQMTRPTTAIMQPA